MPLSAYILASTTPPLSGIFLLKFFLGTVVGSAGLSTKPSFDPFSIQGLSASSPASHEPF